MNAAYFALLDYRSELESAISRDARIAETYKAKVADLEKTFVRVVESKMEASKRANTAAIAAAYAQVLADENAAAVAAARAAAENAARDEKAAKAARDPTSTPCAARPPRGKLAATSAPP